MGYLKLVTLSVVLVALVSMIQAQHIGQYITRRAVLVDDDAAYPSDDGPLLVRVVRSDPYGPKKSKGVTGPVYTFVKTDPYAHFKWGVRHVVGKKYAGH